MNYCIRSSPLLEFYRGPGVLQPALDFFGFFLGGSFFDGLGCLVDESFGFFQP